MIRESVQEKGYTLIRQFIPISLDGIGIFLINGGQQSDNKFGCRSFMVTENAIRGGDGVCIDLTWTSSNLPAPTRAMGLRFMHGFFHFD